MRRAAFADTKTGTRRFEVKSNIKNQTSKIAFLLVLVSLCSGCNYFSQSNKVQYMLSPGQPQQVASEPSRRVLEVDRFSIEAAFATKSFIYRTGERQYETDYYNEFLVLPAQMITEDTRDWLSRTGLFLRVAGPAARVTPTHLMEGNIVDLYGDLRDKNAPKAVMQIRIFVSKLETDSQPAQVFSRDYSAVTRLESHDPAGLVDAYSRCFQKILADLQKDLTEKL
jgi:cholesterol transport system auxiliary component